MVQMHQVRGIGDMPVGGGVSSESEYTTWELKECPQCGRLVVEFYTAIPVSAIPVAHRLVGELHKAISEEAGM